MSAFNILLSGGAYYVSIPNYSGGTVYPEADVKELVAALESMMRQHGGLGCSAAYKQAEDALAKVKS